MIVTSGRFSAGFGNVELSGTDEFRKEFASSEEEAYSRASKPSVYS
jgi:hypothetical protein